MEQGAIIDNAREEIVAKNRFESFKLGMGFPSAVIEKHSHTRSHSRNASISSSVSSSTLFKSTNTTDSSTPVNSAPPHKRNSHHRRRSSVSTRIESAELMGVSIPDLPQSTSEDNVNLGEKDSIRRRALWALEGKPDMAFAKVEIPDMSTPIMEKMLLDLATKPSQIQNSVPSYGPSINALMGSKRDSFKLLGPSSSSKDQLHTLVEEEEEEEDFTKLQEMNSSTEPAEPSATPVTLVLAVTKATPARPRPANLNLRPLSLTPDNLISVGTGLPTPSLTPSPRPGLKALALVPSPANDDATTIMTIRQSTSPSPAPRRLSLNLNFTSESAAVGPNVCDDNKGNRRSSISYKSSYGGAATNFSGLPTPEVTPTSFDRRYSMAINDALRRRNGSTSSTASGDDDPPSSSRPLSASEQHFLFKSHNALLARITDLESALSMRRRSSSGFSASGSSRPVSVASDVSFPSEHGEPSDEMLRLVADLKAERDELKRDVDGWRTRVGDMERQMSILAGRVEAERRDAWVVRSMAGLLEVEKGTLERKLSGFENTISTLQEEKQILVTENCGMKQRVTFLEVQLESAQQALADERAKRTLILNPPEMPSTPVVRNQGSCCRPPGIYEKRNHWFASVDSSSSATDVEDSPDDAQASHLFPLKAVQEESSSDEDNGLAGYEDEEDEDASLQSSSSFDSAEDLSRSTGHLHADVSGEAAVASGRASSMLPPVVHIPRPTHASRASLSKTWTFPKGSSSPIRAVENDTEIDHFFDCLQDDDVNNDDFASDSPSAYSYERSKGLFANGFKYGAEDEGTPFFFPLGAGVEVEPPRNFEAVPREEQTKDLQLDVEDMFGEAGGIRITFTPPEAEGSENYDSHHSPSPSPSKPSTPAVNEITSFSFGRPIVSGPAKESREESASKQPFNSDLPAVSQDAGGLAETVFTSPVFTPITPPSSLPRLTSPRALPSSIPRATGVKSLTLSNDTTTSTPPKVAPTHMIPASSNIFVTPPNKRGGVIPSFIPQFVSSPSPIRSVSGPAKPKGAVHSAASSKQAQQKPLLLLKNNVKSQNNLPGGVAYANTIMNARSLPRFSDARHAHNARSDMKSIDLSDSVRVHENVSYVSASTPGRAYPPFLVDHYTPSSFSCPPPTSQAEALIPSPLPPSNAASPLSARISFRTLTNFIPISWSQCDNKNIPTPHVGDVAKPFVAKEKQLEKLWIRLEHERKMKMSTSVMVHCQKCDDTSVAL